MKKHSYLLFWLLFFQVVHGFAQAHFVVAFNGNGQDHMTIHVLSATLEGVDLKAGDEIAVFDGNICCGVKTLTRPVSYSHPETYVDIAVSKTDAGQANGYTTGNTISYKFWDACRKKEIQGISAAYFDQMTAQPTAAPTFMADESVFVKLSGTLPVNRAPFSDAGANQTVNEGSQVNLNGSASSDPDQDPLTYTWTAPSGIALSSVSVAQPVFTAPEVHADTPYTFSLVVNDGTTNSAVSQTVVTVKHTDKAPYVKAAIMNITADTQSPDSIIHLQTVFADDDPNDNFHYGISANTNPNIVTPEINADRLILNFSDRNTGVSEIEIFASSGGIKATSRFKVEVRVPAGSETDQPGIQIFPNPAKSSVFVKFSRSPETEIRIAIYNTSGKKVYQSSVSDTENHLDLKGIPPGLYFLKAETDTLKTCKLLLQ